ncbi:MAG: hypothetical protein MJ246_02560 [Clostridia bacterium]|nr:hypothetical protein [Clostridia bacterium]
MSKVLVIIIAVLIVALIVVVSVLSSKKTKRDKFIKSIQIKFLNLQSGAKAINESYLRESTEYLMYVAPDCKSEAEIRAGLLKILANYKEAGKISKDGFYDKAYEAITK